MQEKYNDLVDEQIEIQANLIRKMDSEEYTVDDFHRMTEMQSKMFHNMAQKIINQDTK